MANRAVPSWTIMLLTAGILVLPLVIAVSWGVSALLAASGDALGSDVLQYVALACGMLWAVDLVLLVLVLAVGALAEVDDSQGNRPSEPDSH